MSPIYRIWNVVTWKVIWCSPKDIDMCKKKLESSATPKNRQLILTKKYVDEDKIISILNNLEMARGASGI
jgi:hypothetical protein